MPPEPLPNPLRFRHDLYACFPRRRDALFELADAILTAGPVPSLAHLSLEAVHRRGGGSLYAGLAHGRVDDQAVRTLVAPHASTDPQHTTPLFVFDAGYDSVQLSWSLVLVCGAKWPKSQGLAGDSFLGWHRRDPNSCISHHKLVLTVGASKDRPYGNDLATDEYYRENGSIS